jgi:type II secretory pathway pseudopilin PulG
MLLEVMVAAAVLVMTAVGATHALLTANRLAAASRVLTGARAVVQRNIDTALTVTFSQASQPAILAITPAAGTVYDDDGGFDNTIQIAVQDNGGIVVATGTLTRIVMAVANSDGADIRQVTFRLDYSYGGRNQSVSMSTMRSIDD